MGVLSYLPIMSLDGYIADAQGRFEWAMPDEQVHAFVNDLERPIGTYLYGRRLYETMLYWSTESAVTDQAPVAVDFARLWRAADKIVYSTTLTAVPIAKTRLARAFDPDEIRRLKATTDTDISIGGAGLAAAAIRAGLVDEYHLIVVPALVGGGTRALPNDIRIDLELVEQRRFGNGFTYVHYHARG